MVPSWAGSGSANATAPGLQFLPKIPFLTHVPSNRIQRVKCSLPAPRSHQPFFNLSEAHQTPQTGTSQLSSSTTRAVVCCLSSAPSTYQPGASIQTFKAHDQIRRDQQSLPCWRWSRADEIRLALLIFWPLPSCLEHA